MSGVARQHLTNDLHVTEGAFNHASHAPQLGHVTTIYMYMHVHVVSPMLQLSL